MLCIPPKLQRFIIGSSLFLSVTGCSSSLFTTEWMQASAFKPAVMDGHATEQRVITLFTDALAEDNEAAFRKVVSTRFEQKAMRSGDSFRDLSILNLPKTKLEVVESKELPEGSRETVAKEVKEGTKYQFLIVRDESKKRWVVDDVLIRQQKKGTRATKSSVEVMDLLLTVREFLDIWKSSDKETVLSALNSDLRDPLEQLPEPWLQRLIAAVTAEYETDMARRPEAQMNESDAVVKMPSKNGFILMKVVRENDVWLVSDIEVRRRRVDDHPGSILRQARALNTVTRFLSAYGSEDLLALEQLTESRFYQSALRIGDLSMIQLPSPQHAPEDFEIQSFAGQLTVMIPDESSVVRVDLTTPELASKRAESKPVAGEVEAEFIVGNVTVYDRQSQQQKNLKSAFVAPAHAMLFMSALNDRDMPVLRELSCMDLNEKVWRRLDPELIAYLPLGGVSDGNLTLQNSWVRGDVTELEFQSSSGRLFSVIMRHENGDLKIEDVQYPNQDALVTSLKSELTLTLPIIELATAWRNRDLLSVRRNSSLDFNRLVWSNVSELPADYDQMVDALLAPVLRSHVADRTATLELQGRTGGSVVVTLIRENTAWVVDEIQLPQVDGSTVELRKTLRQEMARQFLTNPSGEIHTANYEVSSSTESGIVQAGNSDEPRPRGNLTITSSVRPNQDSASASAIDMTPTSEGSERPRSSVSMRKPDTNNDTTQYFGPSAESMGGIKSHRLSNDSPRTEVRQTAESTEKNGVVYFHGAPGTPSNSDASNQPGRISDLSDHPIDIPLE
jgi:hypothetical protein